MWPLQGSSVSDMKATNISISEEGYNRREEKPISLPRTEEKEAEKLSRPL